MQPITMKLSLKLFGKFELTRNGQPVLDQEWPSRKSLQLLQILVSDRSRVWSQDQLIDAIFAELDPEKAKKSLQARISELRYTLEPDLHKGTESAFIHTTQEGYTFSPDALCEVDLELFSRSIVSGKQLFESGRPAEALAKFLESLRIYRGEFLAEDPYSEWTQTLRSKYAAMQLETLVAAAECYIALEKFAEAYQLAEKAQDLNPNREDACRVAMRSAFGLGDTSRLHAVYDRCVSALKESFNAGPSNETILLFGELTSNGVPSPSATISGSVSTLKREDPEQDAKAYRFTNPAKIVVALTTIAIIAYTIAISTGLTNSSPNYDPRRIAVLQFRNLSEDPDARNYFVEGIHEQLISTLSRIPELEVIAATSVIVLDEELPIAEIAELFEAGTVIESSVRIVDEKFRATIQVIDSSSEAHIWSKDYTKVFSIPDIIDIQSDIALNVAAALNVTLVGQQISAISKPSTENMQAFNLYLEGMHFQKLKGKDNFQRALESYEQAIALDPQFAEAYARLALAYINVGPSEGFSNDMLIDRVYSLLDTALQLDDELSDAHMVLSLVQNRVEKDYDAARRSLENAIFYNPKNSQALNWYAAHLAVVDNEYEEAIDSWKKALVIDPLNHSVYNNLGVISWAIGKVEDSVHYQRKRLEYAENAGSRWKLALSLTQLYRWDEAVAELEKATGIHPESDDILINFAIVLRKIGQLEKAKQLIEKAQAMTLSAAGSAAIAEWYRFDRDYEALVQQAQATYSMDSRFVPSLVRKALGQMYLEDYDAAIATVEEAIQLHPSGGGVETLIEATGAAGLIYARQGEVAKAQEQLQMLRIWDNPIEQNRFTLMAFIEFELGNVDEAFILLESAYEAKEARLTAIRLEPSLDEYRNDSRYLSLIKRMNLIQ